MFCPYCGAPGPSAPATSFYSQCGRKLQAATSNAADWSREARYGTLIQIPSVRELIAAHAVQATPRLSGEDFLKECEKVMGSLLDGVPISKVATMVAPFYGRLGIRTGKSETILHQQPIEITLVAVLCSLARNSQTIRKVQQHEDGCTIEAVIPSDARSFAGELVAEVRRNGAQFKIQAAATIKGQLFDWGRAGAA